MKQVDKHFREKLRDLDSDVPADMWDKIAPAIAKESKRTRPLFWFSLSGALLLVGAVGSYLLFSTSNYGTFTGHSTFLSDTEIETSAGSAITTDVYTQDLASITEARNILAKYDSKNTSVTDILKKADDATGASNNSSQLAVNTGSQPANITTEQVSELAPSSTSLNSTRTSTSAPAASVRMIITETYYEGKAKVSNTNKMTLRSGESSSLSISKLAVPSWQPVRSLNEESGITSFFGGKTPQCPTFVKERPSFYVDGYISHDLAMKSFSGNTTYADIRRETELGQYSFGAGVRLSYYITKNIGMRSGLAYQQVNEQFFFDDPEYRQTRITYEPNESGELVEVGREEVPGRRIVENGNTYRFLDIPLLLFYEITPSKSPFYYSINAGVNVNLLFSQDGRYLAENGTVSNFVNDDEYPNPYNTTAGVSFYTSFAIHYVLNNQIDLMVEPHLTAQLNPMTRDAAPVTERFTIAGINTGIRYKF